ncbi:hypothetical protein EG240_16320 [Paenimyroides tangerinum]|uniref:Uncharacterized protein n=1 Tax=Paenimyroides tangerinum TaxID=2488728 RepID=A0A3P3VX82_9FLAO|nr:hypothetical protein [Paenimyroides tangerinum]RRJ86226.1 hypothetical protein EG240_16320 [Paenimyroides tangerinum]
MLNNQNENLSDDKNLENLTKETLNMASDKIANEIGGEVNEINQKVKEGGQILSQANNYINTAQQTESEFTRYIDKNPNAFDDEPIVHKKPSPSNSALIAANEMFGISHLTKLTIVVEGKQIKNYKHFELSQSTTGHHEFSLTLDYDSLGQPEDHHLENAQKYLGQRILVTFKYKNVPNGPERHFIGVVTKIGLSREHRNLGDLIFSGYSPTNLLDKALHVQSFGGNMAVSLNYVANTVLRQALDEQNYPIFTNSDFGNVGYSCQYNETHYNYLARLAETHGQQFFYDGYTVKFGKLTNPEKPLNWFLEKTLMKLIFLSKPCM